MYISDSYFQLLSKKLGDEKKNIYITKEAQ